MAQRSTLKTTKVGHVAHVCCKGPNQYAEKTTGRGTTDAQCTSPQRACNILGPRAHCSRDVHACVGMHTKCPSRLRPMHLYIWLAARSFAMLRLAAAERRAIGARLVLR